ncbi:hypothetical protein AB0H12_21720 [Actinosynnema sp. NPDC023794]
MFPTGSAALPASDTQIAGAIQTYPAVATTVKRGNPGTASDRGPGTSTGRRPSDIPDEHHRVA